MPDIKQEQIDPEEVAARAEIEAWECVPERLGTTPEQRHALYKFRMPRTLVKGLDMEQAAELQRLLVRFVQQGVRW